MSLVLHLGSCAAWTNLHQEVKQEGLFKASFWHILDGAKQRT